MTKTAAAEDVAAFEHVYRSAYAGTVRAAIGLCGDRHEAEEVAQQAWTNAYRRHLRSPLEDVVPYVHRAVVNEVRSRARRAAVVRAHARLRRPGVAVADASDAVADRLVLAPLLARLPLRMRAAVVLRVVADLSVAQTATVLDITEGAVKSATSRGLARLRALQEETTDG
ncbi:sigma factor-like helix-turn-helix DNA-binding protein [Euzebya sp.]|uniref:sigma factor-like helix-turn-helix DNA-binding protein n=1 Tax=Euzebya sp. TaxID=1971409 RepID=UPI003516A444